MIRTLTLNCPAILICIVMVGCGGAPKGNRIPVFPIKGTVVYKGQPVANADVTFVCEEKSRSAFGRTDEEGHFKLTTYGANDGAVAGKHIVKVVKIESQAQTKEPDINDPAYDPIKLVNDAAKQTKPKNEIPKKYADHKTSDVIVMVLEDGQNPEMTIELKD